MKNYGLIYQTKQKLLCNNICIWQKVYKSGQQISKFHLDGYQNCKKWLQDTFDWLPTDLFDNDIPDDYLEIQKTIAVDGKKMSEKDKIDITKLNIDKLRN